jgi:hypothetical protein
MLNIIFLLLLIPGALCQFPFFIMLLWKSNIPLNGKFQDSFDELGTKFFQTAWSLRLDLAHKELLTKTIDTDFAFYFERWIIRYLLVYDCEAEVSPLAPLPLGDGESFAHSFLNLASQLSKEIQVLASEYVHPLAILNTLSLFLQELSDSMTIIFYHGDPNPDDRRVILNRISKFIDSSDGIFTRTKHFLMLENIKGPKKDNLVTEPFRPRKGPNAFFDILYLKHCINYLNQLMDIYYLDFIYIELIVYNTIQAKARCPENLKPFMEKLFEEADLVRKRWLKDYYIDGNQVEVSMLTRFYLFNSSFFGIPFPLITKHLDKRFQLLPGDQIILRMWDTKFKLYQVCSAFSEAIKMTEAIASNNQHFNILMDLHKIFNHYNLVSQAYSFYQNIHKETTRILTMWNMGKKERLRLVLIQGDTDDSIFRSPTYSHWKASVLSQVDEKEYNSLYKTLQKYY